jgi:helix-turn-helix protein
MADSTIYRDTIQPTLAEVAESRPPRASGAPSRTRSHYERILALLRDRGPAGVLSSELYDSPELYGRSPRNRISELRQAGHLIRTIPAGGSVVRYVLAHENPVPAPARPEPRRPEPLKTLFDLTRDPE